MNLKSIVMPAAATVTVAIAASLVTAVVIESRPFTVAPVAKISAAPADRRSGHAFDYAELSSGTPAPLRPYIPTSAARVGPPSRTGTSPMITFGDLTTPPIAHVTSVPSRHSLSPLLLGQLIDACAPAVDPATQAAVVAVESSGNAWALHDNNDDRSYQPATYPEAVAVADALIAENVKRYGARDRGVDVGVAQINSNNFAGYAINAALMLHPCANLRKSSEMLSRAIAAQSERLHDIAEPKRTELAKRAAFAIYNSGHAYGDDAYVHKIEVALASPQVLSVLSGTPITPYTGAFPASYMASPPIPPEMRADTNFAHVPRAGELKGNVAPAAAGDSTYQLTGAQFAHHDLPTDPPADLPQSVPAAPASASPDGDAPTPLPSP